jgi:hypothetical protein
MPNRSLSEIESKLRDAEFIFKIKLIKRFRLSFLSIFIKDVEVPRPYSTTYDLDDNILTIVELQKK